MGKHKQDLVEVVLTCGSWQEAQRVADDLLQKYLVGSVEFLEVEAKQWRKSGLAGAKEVKLIIQTVAQELEAIEQAVTALSSHNPALQKTLLA